MVFNTVIKQTKYFANQLQHKKDKSIIPAILDPTGNINQNPQIINNISEFLQQPLLTHSPTYPIRNRHLLKQFDITKINLALMNSPKRENS